MGTKKRTKARSRGPATKGKTTDDGISSNGMSSKLRSNGISNNAIAVISATVLVVAVVFGLLGGNGDEVTTEVWNQTDPELQRVNTFLSDFVCRALNGYCHPNVEAVPSRRTQRTTSKIRSGDTVLEIPRELQIWDLDALRDSYVRNELLKARHGGTGNGLDSGAFLAAYLARRLKISGGSWGGEDGTSKEDPMAPYLQILPTYDDFSTFHPAAVSKEILGDLLGKQTLSFSLAQSYTNMVESEYASLSAASVSFAEHVSREEYVAMRINVMSRSFGPGPPGKEESLTADGEHQSLEEELEYYQAAASVNLTKGCRAMCPLLDMYDHHTTPNVDWRYEPSKRAFVIKASWGGIQAGYDIVDSYGKYTDAHLFAKFGFVNGDGSAHTEGSIAVLHKMLDVGLRQQFSLLSVHDNANGGTVEQHDTVDTSVADMWMRQQKKDLIRYLQFDDGYVDCIVKGEASDDDWTLKQLKYKHLEKIANIRNRWVLLLGPRQPNSKPAISTAVPIMTGIPKFNSKQLDFDGSKLVSTCRLISLTNNDFGGDAIRVLEDVLTNGTASEFFVEKQTDELEFRAMTCLVRLSQVAITMCESSFEKLATSVETNSFRSLEWTAAHVRLGEMQTLEVLRHMSASGAKAMLERMNEEESASLKNRTRHRPCPLDYSRPLLDE